MGLSFDAPSSRWQRLLTPLPLRLLLWLLVTAAVGPAYLAAPHHVADYFDDHQFHSWEQSNRITVLRYGELPQWNPYWCGGTLGVAAPEDTFFSPDYWLLRLPFGVSLGRHLAIIAMMIMGMEGMFRLARRFGSSLTGAVVAAVTYASYVRFAEFIREGAINFVVGFELLPWALLSLVLGMQSWRWRLAGGFFVGWAFVAAGTYPGPFAAIVLAFVAVALAIAAKPRGQVRGWLPPLKSLLGIGGVAFALSACKLVPLLVFLAQFKRVWLPVEANMAQDLLLSLLPHYGLVLGLALVGLIVADGLSSLLFAAAAFFFVLAMGDFGPLSPYHLLKQVPLFKQLRVPSRYLVPVVLFLCLGAGRTLGRLEQAAALLVANALQALKKLPKLARIAQPVGYLLAAAAAVAALVLPVRAHIASVSVAADQVYVVEPPLFLQRPFAQSRGNRRDAHIFAPLNLGSLYCITGIPVPESPLLRGDLAREEYALDPAAKVVRRDWTPNSLQLAVEATAATIVLVNQNYDRHWRSSLGTVVNHQGLLAVQVPAGKHVLQLQFRDWLLLTCIALSALTLAVLLGLWLAHGLGMVRGWWRQWRQLPWLAVPTSPLPVANAESMPLLASDPTDDR